MVAAARPVGDIIVNDVFGTAAKVVFDTNGITKICRFGQSIIEALGLILGAISKGVSNLATVFNIGASIGDFVEPIKRLYQVIKNSALLEKGETHWTNVASLVAALVGRALGMVNLINKVAGGIPALSDYVSTVGSAYVIVPIAISGCAFTLANESINLNENPIHMEVAQAAQEFVSFKATLRNKVKTGMQLTDEGDDKTTYNRVMTRLNTAAVALGDRDIKLSGLKQLLGVAQAEALNVEGIDQKVATQWTAFSKMLNERFNSVQAEVKEKQSENNSKEAESKEGALDNAVPVDKEVVNELISLRMDHDVKVWSAEIVNAEVNKSKAIFGIIASIIKIVLLSFIMLSVITGASFAAIGSPLMVALGFVVTGVALAQVIFKELYDKSAPVKIDDKINYKSSIEKTPQEKINIAKAESLVYSYPQVA